MQIAETNSDFLGVSDYQLMEVVGYDIARDYLPIRIVENEITVQEARSKFRSCLVLEKKSPAPLSRSTRWMNPF